MGDPEQVPSIRFASARRSRLAYQCFGTGTETVVAVPPLAQNIEMAWEQPAIARMLRRFGSFCRYLHFDKRGTGCSDRTSRVADVDERVEDLRAVMDDAGIGRAHLFGNSEGGPMTLLFAATYPDRVASLILFGTGASLHPAEPSDAYLAERREINRRFAEVWGTSRSPVAENFAPSLVAEDPSFRAWHQRYERFAAGSDSLEELLELGFHLDTRPLLGEVRASTLILHRTDDRIVPLERAHEIAALLPDARVVELPGEDHFSYAGDVDAWMDEFERFVTGQVRSVAVSELRRPSVRIVTLGRFAVEVDGDELPTSAWGSRRSRQLCKRLVAARGWPVTRDELFELLWPGETSRTRLGARLSVQLSTVRRILRGGVIADRESVRLDLDEVDTDLEALYRAGDDAAVVAAYAGDFLPDDVYDDWTRPARDEARSRFVLAALRLARSELEAGRADRAATLARRLLEVDAYDDGAHQLLVTALLAAGAPGEARRAHATWTAVMGELDLPVASFETFPPG